MNIINKYGIRNQLRSANGSAERNRYKDTSGSRKKSVSRFEEPHGSFSERPQHTDFLDRFKNVSLCYDGWKLDHY